MNQPSYITLRKHTFLSSAALGLSAIVITLLISCTVMALFAVHLAGQKTERVISLAQSAVRGLPEFTQSLPPALSDMLNDRRDPRYCDQLGICAKVVSEPSPHGGIRTAIEITNNGDAVVSLLSLRITVLDDKERLLCESQEWAATPVMADDGWRGPIMPGSKRRFISRAHWTGGSDPAGALSTQVEITELRVWNETKNDAVPGSETGMAVSTLEPVTPENGWSCGTP
jgi:hypothetical protein